MIHNRKSIQTIIKSPEDKYFSLGKDGRYYWSDHIGDAALWNVRECNTIKDLKFFTEGFDMTGSKFIKVDLEMILHEHNSDSK